MAVNTIRCGSCGRDDFEDFDDFEQHDCDVDSDDDDGGAPKVAADGGVDLAQWRQLTGFRRDILRTIRIVDAARDVESTYGLAIKRQLEADYGEEVNHGRLYPNLDDLVNKGLVEKAELDKRTNEYNLTSTGEDLLELALQEDAHLLDNPSTVSRPEEPLPTGRQVGGDD